MRSILATFLIFLCFSGCIEPIELGLENEPGIVVIEGIITNGPGPHRIEVTRTVTGQRVPEPITSAQVTLLDDQGNSYPYFQELPGQHIIPFGAVSAHPGSSYFVRVELADGRVYESTSDRMPSKLAKDTTYYEFTEFSEINENGITVTTNSLEAYIDSDIPQSDEPLYYRWIMEEAYEFRPTDFPDPFGAIPDPCYFVRFPDPQRINLYNSLEEAPGRITGRLLARRPINSALIYRYFINVYQYAMTQEAHNYWENVSRNIEQTGSIFDIPPATVRGNFVNVDDPNEIVYGYFGASAVTVTRTELRESDVPNFIIDPCEFNPFGNRGGYPADCLRCFDSNLSTDKPTYF